MYDYFENPAAMLCSMSLRVWKGRMKSKLAELSNSPQVHIFRWDTFKVPKYEVWVYPNGVSGVGVLTMTTHPQKSYDDAVKFAFGQPFTWFYVTDSTHLSLDGGEFICNPSATANFVRQLSPECKSIYRQVRRMSKKKHLVKFMGYVLGQTPNWKNRKQCKH